MGQKRALFLIMPVIFLAVAGCKDGVKFPWSKDKPHEAEVTADSLSALSDSAIAGDLLDSTAMVLEDSLAQIDDPSSSAESSPQVSNTKQWRVVVSSMPSQQLAQRFISRHAIEDADVLYVERLNTYRVVQASFPELSDAQVEFGLIKSDFPEAWLVYF